MYSQEEIDKILTRFRKNEVFTYAFLTACYTGLRICINMGGYRFYK